MARKKVPIPAESSSPLSLDCRLPSHKLLPYDQIASSNVVAVEQSKLNEISHLLWLPESLSREDRDAGIVRAIDLFESVKPAEGIEAMLAVQMIGTHSAVVECLRRAMLPNQTFEGRNASLGHAQRLMGLYTRQLAALDKHRGKGQQKVTVEHVHVAAGGQAIVGNVETGADGIPPPRRKVAPPQLEHQVVPSNPLDALDTAPATARSASKARRD